MTLRVELFVFLATLVVYVHVAQLSEKDSKIKEQLAQLQLTHQNDVRNTIITGHFLMVATLVHRQGLI